ncbi:sensor histidine kinase [Micromonospora sp. NPDC050397]|uniref:sensor histidine kinase n=1 Tax=Micromonospora sp. NPDC050397 TaxID=3364279 RepID=UPI00384E6E65
MEQPADPIRATLGDLRRLSVGRDRTYRSEVPPRWWRRIRGWLVPVLLLALIGLTAAANEYLVENRGLTGSHAFALAVGSSLPVALAPRWPLLAWRLGYLMLFLGTAGATLREPWPWNPVQIIGFLFVLVLLAVRVPVGMTAWAGLLTLVPVFLFVGERANAYGVVVLVVAVLAVGDQVRRRRQSQRALAEQAELSELAQARRAVLEERTRIARELHDVVAHHMSMIAVQAETAPYRLDELPEPARTEFAAIAASARGALTDMRRLLGVLRSESGTPETAPQPGLADLPELVGTAERAGMTVSMTTEPPPPDAPSPPEAVGLAAYRIVQEALANAARHAPGAPVRVTLRPGRRDLRVRVDNSGGPPGATPPVAGHGLVGMRERARLLGGTFTAEPTPEGFTVTAVLPYETGETR